MIALPPSRFVPSAKNLGMINTSQKCVFHYLTPLTFFQGRTYNVSVKSMEFDNFESVWQRVTAQDEELPLPAPPQENKREEKLCVIKRSQKSCAVRFVAGQ